MKILYEGAVPNNMHGHLRIGDMLKTTVSHAAMFNHYYTAMGNHKGWPTSAPARAARYRKMIVQENERFGSRVNIPCHVQEDTTPEIIRKGFLTEAWIASKMMPRGVTTHSDEGVRPDKMRGLYPMYEMQAELSMPALFHGMRPHDPIGREIDWYDQEKRFIDLLGELLVAVPKLKVVYEHITTREAASFVRWCQTHGYDVEATVAPQYLVRFMNWLFVGGINPGNYSIPPIQGQLYQEALIDFVTLGFGFRGNDSAPHLHEAKELYCGCAGGIYSDAFGLDLIAYFMIFKAANALDRFEAFTSTKGPTFYGLPPAQDDRKLYIVEEEWTVPDQIPCAGSYIIPLFAGEKLPYRAIVS